MRATSAAATFSFASATVDVGGRFFAAGDALGPQRFGRFDAGLDFLQRGLGGAELVDRLVAVLLVDHLAGEHGLGPLRLGLPAVVIRPGPCPAGLGLGDGRGGRARVGRGRLEKSLGLLDLGGCLR